MSYNRPKLDLYAVWNPNAVTLADSNIVGSLPWSIFIDTNNTIYAVDHQNSGIKVWMNESINPTTSISSNLLHPVSIFVTSNGDIYIDNQYPSFQVNRWQLNTNNRAIAMYVDGYCLDLFVDVNNLLYCSIRDKNKVVSKSLYNASNILTIVAGTGCNGSTSNSLNGPHGIFVDINLDLYVADTFNHRIQLFRSGSSNAITIAGSGSLNVTITLNRPADIVLDADKNLFIVDHANHRIVGPGPNGFRCIIGCTGSSGSTSNTLALPMSMAFDSHGNIHVVDLGNRRIQKFLRLNNTLGKYLLILRIVN